MRWSIAVLAKALVLTTAFVVLCGCASLGISTDPVKVAAVETAKEKLQADFGEDEPLVVDLAADVAAQDWFAAGKVGVKLVQLATAGQIADVNAYIKAVAALMTTDQKKAVADLHVAALGARKAMRARGE